jgi:hypothetical protein
MIPGEKLNIGDNRLETGFDFFSTEQEALDVIVEESRNPDKAEGAVNALLAITKGAERLAGK